MILNERLSLLWRILSGVVTTLFSCYMAGAMQNCCHLDAHSVYIVQARTMSCHSTHSRIHRVHAHSVYIVQARTMSCHSTHSRIHRVHAHSVYIVQARTMSCHFTHSRIHRVHAHLVVTFHVGFWQNDQDLFTCYCGNIGVEWTPSQHRKLTLEKKILPPLLPGLFNQRLYDHEIGALTTELCPLPNHILFFLQYSSLSQETAPQISSFWM